METFKVLFKVYFPWESNYPDQKTMFLNEKIQRSYLFRAAPLAVELWNTEEKESLLSEENQKILRKELKW